MILRDMVVGARQAVLSISQTAQQLGFSPGKVAAERKKTITFHVLDVVCDILFLYAGISFGLLWLIYFYWPFLQPTSSKVIAHIVLVKSYFYDCGATIQPDGFIRESGDYKF